MTTSLLTLIITEVIQNGPAVIAEIQSLFATGTPTLADLQALRTKLENETYAGFVPASAITTPQPPANVIPMPAQSQPAASDPTAAASPTTPDQSQTPPADPNAGTDTAAQAPAPDNTLGHVSPTSPAP